MPARLSSLGCSCSSASAWVSPFHFCSAAASRKRRVIRSYRLYFVVVMCCFGVLSDCVYSGDMDTVADYFVVSINARVSKPLALRWCCSRASLLVDSRGTHDIVNGRRRLGLFRTFTSLTGIDLDTPCLHRILLCYRFDVLILSKFCGILSTRLVPPLRNL